MTKDAPDIWFSLLDCLFAAQSPSDIRKAQATVRRWVRQNPCHNNLPMESVLTLDDVAYRSWEAFDLPGAALRWRKALRLAECLPSETEYVALLRNNLAMALADSDPLEAIRLLRTARTWYNRHHPGSLKVAATLTNLGNMYLRMGRVAAGTASIEAALVLEQQHQASTYTLADTYRNLGIAHAKGGRNQDALAVYRTALSLYDLSEGTILDRAAVWGNIVNLLLDYGDLSGAEDYAVRALNVYEKMTPGTPPHASALATLGLVYEKRGDLETAERVLRGALAIEEICLPDSLAVARTRISLGAVLRRQKRFLEAKESVLLAVAIESRMGSDGAAFGESYGNLANLLIDEGDYASALNLHLTVWQTRRRLDADPIALARAESNIAECYQHLGNLKAAIRYRRRAWQTFIRRVGFSRESFQVARGLVLSLCEMGRMQEVMVVLDDVDRRVEGAIALLREDYDRLSLLNSVQDLMDLYLRTVQDPARRFAVLNRGRGRLVRLSHRERQPGHQSIGGLALIEGCV